MAALDGDRHRMLWHGLVGCHLQAAVGRGI